MNRGRRATDDELVTVGGVVVNRLGEPVGGHPAMPRDDALVLSLDAVQRTRDHLGRAAAFTDHFHAAHDGEPRGSRVALDVERITRAVLDRAQLVRQLAAEHRAAREHWLQIVPAYRGFRGENDDLIDLPGVPDVAYDEVRP